MPCSDGGRTDESELREQLDKVTRLLCLVCSSGLVDNFIKRDAELSEWWDAHIQADAARIKKEHEEKELERKMNKALSKLTQEERELLGF